MSTENRSNEEIRAENFRLRNEILGWESGAAFVRAERDAAIAENARLLARIAAVEAACATVEADDEEHLNRFGQHLPGSVVCVAEMIRASLAASPTPTGPETHECGHGEIEWHEVVVTPLYEHRICPGPRRHP